MHSRRCVRKCVLWLAQYCQGIVPWQLCSASVKPAGTIQVSLKISKTIP